MSVYPDLPRYKIRSAIHRSVHSTLYLAETDSALSCAVKVFTANGGKNYDGRSRTASYFLRELEVLATSHHPNLIRLLDFGCTLDAGEEFLALEWLQGEDFVSASKKASRRDFYGMLAQVCRALHYLHRRDLVHGDLKPDNLIVIPNSTPTPDAPVVKLLDFGYTTSIGSELAAGVQGSPLYMAPEVIQGGPPTCSSDLYSFGVILYECLSGRTPFVGEEVGSILRQHIQQSPPPISGEILRELHSLIQQLMSKDPARRPSSGEVLHQINAVSTEGQFPLHTFETYDACTSTWPTPVRARWDAACRQFITEALLGSAPSRPSIIVVLGDRGSGKTRLLRDTGIYAWNTGFRVHLLTTPSTTDIRELTSASFSDHKSPPASVPLALCYDDFSPAAMPALEHQLTSFSSTPSIKVCALSLDTSLLTAADRDGTLAALASCGRVLALTLQPFEQADISCVLEKGVGARHVKPDVVDSIFCETGGTPAMVAQLSAAALDQQVIVLEQGTLRLQREFDTIHLPSPLVRRLTASLDHLPDRELTVAMLLAVAGTRLALPDIATLTGLDLPLAATLCEDLTLQGITRTYTEATPLFGTSSHALNRMLLHRIPASRKHAFHESLAAWHLRQTATDRHLELAATHYAAAGMPTETVHYSMSAARRGEERLDHVAAAKYFALALEVNPIDPSIRVAASIGLSSALRRLGKLSDALRVLDELSAQGNLSSRVLCDIEMGKSAVAETSGDLLTMESTARSAWRLASQAGLNPESNLAMLQLGSALCLLERRDEGLRLLYRSVAHAQAAGDGMTKASALGSIAECHWTTGHYLPALRYSRRSHGLRRAHNEPCRVGLGEMNIGLLQSDLGIYSRARNTHRLALQGTQRSRSRSWEGVTLNNIGDTYRAQGRLKLALKSFRNAADVMSGSGASFTAYTLDYNIAHVLTRSGHYPSALSYLKHRVRSFRALGRIQGICGLNATWAGFLLATGRGDLAARVAEHACRFAQKTGFWAYMLELTMLHALTLHAKGDPNEGRTVISNAIKDYESRSPFDVRLSAHLTALQIDRALGLSPEALDERLEPLLDKARKKKMAWHTTWGLTLRGEALLEAGRGEEAEKDLTEAIKIAQKNADRPQFWKASYWLGRVFEQRLQYERALGCYRVAALTVNELAMDLDDERYREPFLAQSEVREVQARFERLRAEVGRKARHDIAAMSRSEKISRRMLNALNAIGQKLTSILDLDDLLTHLLDLSIENVRAERGMVFLRDEATGEMRLACARNMDKESLDEVSSFSKGVIKQVAEGHTLLEVNVGKDPALSAYKSLVIHEIKSILCVPMRTRGRTVGVIYLDTRRAAQMFTDKERTFVESFASQAAIAIENARLFGDINAENARLKREAAGKGRFESLIGTSPAMQRLSDTISGVLGSDCNVLIVGESGTGKELVAKAVHYNGPRQKKKFVAIDCGALPESLLEAELFGFARGAFTGADRDKVGLIEEARGGTLFLDEITNTSVALQARLLRVLQEHEVRRVGENTPRRVDVRVVAATNADIAALMKEGKFRSDLYYRLNVVTIDVPPLRERREDIPLLVEHFIRRRSGETAPGKRLAPGVVEALGRYDWPGNVRELENVIERLLVLAPGPVITQEALPDNIRAAAGLREVTAAGGRDGGRDAGSNGGGNGPKTGEQMMVEDALRRFAGDKAKAARFIGWNRQKLYRKMKGFGIPADYGRTV